MKRMLISVDLEESRAAVIESGKLTHLEIEPVSRDTVKGNIYRGVIARVEPSLQSAFVDFGRDKQGFLPVGEIHPRLKPDSADKRAPIQELIRAGQQIIVQVQRDEIGQKGATLSTFISLPGRYLVLMPESDKTGVSRKLSDSARERVKDLTDTMKVPDGMGLIVRTAGETATKLELSKDLVYLNRLWEHIQQEGSKGRGATLLYQERSLAIRFVRDYYRRDIEEIVIDDDDAHDEVSAYLSVLMPKNVHCIERYAGTVPLFARYGVQSQVEDVFSRQVPLPSGGSIVIDQTEALVAVDVNSGRVKGKDIEETALQTNIEAAQEVARQLVLRDLGGLVVVDFIDMRDRKAVREVESALKNAMKLDKARHKIGRISEFGLLELSRQRLKSSVNKGAFESCMHCSGTGFSRTPPSIAASVLRRVYELVAKGGVSYVIAQVPPDAAAFLLNNKRGELADIERQYHVSIEIVAVEGLTGTQVSIEHLSKVPERSGADRLKVARFDRVAQQLDLVRNRLLKREETRIERQLQKHLSGSRIDYAEVYADVGEHAADARAEEAVADAKRKAAAASAPPAASTAPVRTAPTVPAQVALDDEPVPTQSGFGSWLKGLFGLNKPAPSLDSAVIEEPEAAPAPALPAPKATAAPAAPPAEPRQRPAERAERAEASADDSDEGRGHRRRGRDDRRDDRRDDDGDEDARRKRRRRGGRRRGRDDEGGDGAAAEAGVAAKEAPEAKAAAPAAEVTARESTDEADEAGEDGRRRRRRGGRRRRGRRDEGDARGRGEGQDGAGDGADDNDADADDVAAAAAVAAVEADASAADSAELADGAAANDVAEVAAAADAVEGSEAGAAAGDGDAAEGGAAADTADGAAADEIDDGAAGSAVAAASVAAADVELANGAASSEVAVEGEAQAEVAGAADAVADADAGASAEEDVEMTDALALAAAEIERLRASEATAAGAEAEADEATTPPPLPGAEAGKSNRFVIDLRSGGGS